MFYQTVRRGPLTSEDADLFFSTRNGGKIVGTSILNDYSFLGTMRALLGNRIDADSTFALSVSVIAHAEDVDLLRPMPNAIDVVYVDRSASNKRDEIIEKIREKVASFEGYKNIEKVTQYYGAAFKAYAWSCEEKNTAIIATDYMDSRRLHILQACIPVVLPWFFKPDESGKKFSPEEIELLSSLENKGSDTAYLKAIEKIAKQYDMREAIIRHRLDGISRQFRETEMKDTENRISSIESDISDYYSRVEGLLRDRQDLITRLYGLKERLKEGGADSELADYFLCNKSLILGRVEGTRVNFFVKGYLEYWDDECAESTIDNDDAYIYDIASNCGYPRNDARALLSAIFVDRTVKVKYYAGYRLDIAGGIRANADGDFPSELESNYMPNPHISRYDCLGEYKRKILDCISNGNIIAAFENCVSSAKSLNWFDSTVLEKFVEYVFNGDYACFELPNGDVVDVSEAVTWAKG